MSVVIDLTRPFHIAPIDGREHVFDDESTCWCHPTASTVNPKTGLPYPGGNTAVTHRQVAPK